MAYFKQGGNNRGGSFSGGNDPRRPGFAKKSWGDDRGGKPLTLHKAVCAECGNGCEVPFRPLPGKTVFCKDCFAKQGGGDRDDRAPRREFRPAPARPAFQQDRGQGGQDRGMSDVKHQLELLNSKIDRLIQVAEEIAHPKIERSLKEIVDTALEPTEKPKKKAALKPVAKKKK